ncbi:NADP-dependent oxidoreductase [Humitalea sp. 24SJ18S-53]|uniref:NADP-dependent oxidoreductase n=1 Tax=Humitalea sp. 24SJ18S-53 TaxID=3422307 RepID=UPI003D664D2E
MRNRKWVLADYATGAAGVGTWAMAEDDRPVAGPGQILVRTLWLSVDPYMRGRLNKPAPGTKGLGIGDVMIGGGVGEVVASNHPAWRVGDVVESLDIGWQEHAVLTPDLTGVIRCTRGLPPEAFLSWLGMPGLTAYFGMMEVGRPRPGDTVVVSAASGGVGQIAGQIAKIAGCRVVGIAGSDEKLAWCREIGFDEVINYKTTDNLTKSLAACCPDGVDFFYDNTGGEIHDAVLRNLANFAKVVICGRIAVANLSANEDIGLRASSRMIATRATIQGLTMFDWMHRRDEAVKRLSRWRAEKRLQFREDVLDGFDQVPAAFVRMMSGQNFGKQLVRL